MAGQCRKSPFCACAACALDREGEYLQMFVPYDDPRKLQTVSTKVCPKCMCSDLVCLRSQNMKICANCKHEIDWPLTEGQKPLL